MTAQARMIDAIPVVTDATARDAWWPSATRPIGARVHRLDTNTVERWNGSVWLVDFTGAVASEAWVTPALSNSWVAVGGNTIQYRLDRNGVLWLRGIIQSGVAGTVFVLPAGYRPSRNVAMLGVGYTLNAAAFVPGTVPLIGIGTDGTVSASVSGTVVAVGFDGANFSVT